MAMQLKPLVIARRCGAPHEPAVMVPLEGGKPAAEFVEIKFGNGITTRALLIDALKSMTLQLEGAALDMEAAP